ncbi:hypothetical protein [Planctomycetes bacterium TBK1r]|uniref:Uncharacterized protein n=1 Tax=Stieleria magnilauensis TaxID=2527963 RepID=A0ABX5Y068_9BACT|nr:hypothetical protein TBK1r_66990 [Planctomycetes bacterium TBK1r]
MVAPITVHRFNVLCLAVLLCIACPVAADAETLRVGLIDPIDGYGLPVERLPQLRRCLVTVDDSGSIGNSIHLAKCPHDVISVSDHSVQGVCGRPIELPHDWDLDTDLRLYRGVACGPWRPATVVRERLLEQRPNPLLSSPWSKWKPLAESNVPNDVIARINKRGAWQVAFDWDANLVISEDEVFTLPPGSLEQPHLFQRDDAILMMQPVANPTSDSADQLRLKCWTISGSTRDTNRRSEPSLLSLLLQASGELPSERGGIELVWLDVGGLLPADLGAAMDAAKRLGCEVVFANLDSPGNVATDTAQLLAWLSHQTGVAVMLNQRTTVAPDFLAHPAKTSIPDIAEFRDRVQPGSLGAFRQTTKLILQDPTLLRRTVAEQPGSEPSGPINALFGESTAALSTQRFQRIDGRTEVVARVPLDAIDGRLLLSDDGPALRLHQVEGIRLYDLHGQRIGGPELNHLPGGNHGWPTQTLDHRGGYVVAPEAISWMGKTWNTTDPQCQLSWTRGTTAIVEKTTNRTGSEQPESIRLIGSQETPDTLILSAVTRVEQLERKAESEVPSAVLQSASHLLNRGPSVQSWWYRASTNGGAVRDQTVLQAFGGTAAAWDQSHLQCWTLLETGWLQTPADRLGAFRRSSPQAGWIFVQAVKLPGSPNQPPRLVLASSLKQEAPEDPWERTLHQHRASETTFASDGRLWVDEYRGTMPPMSMDGADALWYAFHSPGERSPARRWLRLLGDPSEPAEPRDWLWHYDHDPAAELLHQRLLAGSSPSEILSRIPKPADSVDDPVAWRSYLLALDQPSLRKQHLNEVVVAADHVLELCRQRLGQLPVQPASAATETKTAESEPASPFSMPTDPAGILAYAWAADAAYRQVRAIGYRELPDVIERHPIKDMESQTREFESAFARLCGIVDILDPRFALALVRHERRRGHPAKAYQVLYHHAYEGPAMAWYFKKERDLWSDSGWEPLRRLGHARWFLRQANEPVMH